MEERSVEFRGMSMQDCSEDSWILLFPFKDGAKAFDRLAESHMKGKALTSSI